MFFDDKSFEMPGPSCCLRFISFSSALSLGNKVSWSYVYRNAKLFMIDVL